jgi:hypothetical protein
LYDYVIATSYPQRGCQMVYFKPKIPLWKVL